MKLTTGRQEAMEAGLRKAIAVPLSLAKHVDTLWDTLIQLALVANINCKSDLQVYNGTRLTFIIFSFFFIIHQKEKYEINSSALRWRPAA